MKLRVSLAAGLVALVAVSIASALRPPAASAVCRLVDGTSPTGTRFGSSPVKYEYGNSPYMGVRFDSCGDVLRLYYGGYTGNTHYNLRFTNPDPRLGDADRKQIEVSSGAARVYTLTAAPYHTETGGGRRFFVAVQACSRGTGLFSTSTCTRWSPTVNVIPIP